MPHPPDCLVEVRLTMELDDERPAVGVPKLLRDDPGLEPSSLSM
jgi:hypothetical protein